VLVDMIQRCDS